MKLLEGSTAKPETFTTLADIPLSPTSKDIDSSVEWKKDGLLN